MPYTCPYCSSNKSFTREADLVRHQVLSPQCAAERYVVEQVRTAQLDQPDDPYESESDPEFDDSAGDGFGPGENPLTFVDLFDIPSAPAPFRLPESVQEPPGSPGTTTSVARATLEEPNDEFSYAKMYQGAAQVVAQQQRPLAQLFDISTGQENPYAPYFKSRKDWDLAFWAKTRSVSNEAVDSMLRIPGLVDTSNLSFKNSRELNAVIDNLPLQAPFKHTTIAVSGQVGTYDLFHCNPLDVVRDILADPTLAPFMTWEPELLFEDENATIRLNSEITASDWMWHAQARIPVGGTLIPIIISTDKTQLTAFSGEHSAYPVYMTIGNVAKHIRRQPSRRAYRLIGYLPTLKPDETNLSADQARTLRTRLFHKAMEVILEPLFAAARDGALLSDSAGCVRRCHTLLAAYVADFPEQCLVTCVRYGQTCPKCHVTVDQFGSHKLGAPRGGDETLATIEAARKASTAADRERILKAAGVNNIIPFWAHWPFANGHAAISPDSLHQVIQGVGAHLIQWLTVIVGEEELDARMSRLPPAHDLRHFARGISCLSRVSGSERKAIYAQILGAILGRVPQNVIRATRALLDVIYIGQFECHSDTSLAAFQDALDTFHRHKNAFQRCCPALDFNFPKMHMLEHWANDIRTFGTTDNTNTEATERMHIEFAKDAFKASNRRDYIIQMCRWLQRRQAVHLFAIIISIRTGEDYQPLRRPPRKKLAGPINFTVTPQHRAVAVADLEADHHIPNLKTALRIFLQQWHGCRGPNWSLPLPVHVERQLMLTSHVDVWRSVRFQTPDLQTYHAPDIFDIAHATPGRVSRGGNAIAARFDTVLVETQGDGIAGIGGLTHVRAGRLRALIRLSAHDKATLFLDKRHLQPLRDPPEHLAIIEWYTPFTRRNPDSHLYRISRCYADQQRRIPEVEAVEALDLRRSCHLLPDFGRADVDRNVQSITALDFYDDYYLNDLVDKHAYHTM